MRHSLISISIIFFFLLPINLSFELPQNGDKLYDIELKDCKPKWGKDSVKAVQNYSLYTEELEQNAYNDALPEWRYVFNHAPGALESIYIDGTKLMEHQIEQHPDKKQAYVDTLLMLYDQRMKCFGRKGDVLGRKGIRMYKYRPKAVEKTLQTFQEAVKLDGKQTGYYILPIYFATAVRAYKNEIIDKNKTLKIYAKVSSIIGHHVTNNTKYAAKYKDAEQRINNFLKKIKLIQSCQDAKSIYVDRYRKHPKDTLLWKNMFGLMKNADCQGDTLFSEVTLKLFKHNPTPQKAFHLARSYKAQGSFEKSAQYYKKAAKTSEDKHKKGRYYYSLAQLYHQKLSSYPKARQYANKALEYRPNWGDPYILIGDLYAASGDLCGPGKGFKSQVVIWPAMDMYEKAKSVDPSVKKLANKKISNYNEYLPSKEDCFMRNLKEGDTYKVDNCWINRETKVRYSE